MNIKSLILITQTNVDDWTMHKNIVWSHNDFTFSLSPTKIKDVQFVFVYFSRIGLVYKGTIISYEEKNKRLLIKLDQKLNSPISIKRLVDLDIFPFARSIQGSKRYMFEDKTNLLIKIFESENAV